MIWQARKFRIEFPQPVLLMGVVNVTPDSFSDGGRFFGKSEALDQARRLAGEGAGIIDLGGESTRPGAAAVDLEEELRRVLPVVEKLAGELNVPISVDTMKVEVARRALDSGASVINNVADNLRDSAMAALVAGTGCGYVAMHMQGTPQSMQNHPAYEEVVGEIDEYLGGRLRELEAQGVRREQVVLDPGVGFGKTAGHNLRLLSELGAFIHWNRPLLFGVSRKSFLGHLSGAAVDDRLAASLACACWGVMAGAHIIRVHDVKETVQAVRVLEEIRKQA